MHATTVTVRPFGSEHACTLDLAAIYQHFQDIPDLRDRRGVRYPLALLLTIALWAKLTGASQLRAIAEWARERQGELAERFDLPRPRMPHPTTWSRVFGSAVAIDALDQHLSRLLTPPPTAEEPLPAAAHIALDGKTLRGTIPQGRSQGVHLVSAYAVGTGRVLDQEAVASKENELVAAPRLLERTDLRGCLITGDALFAQRTLSTQIVEAGGHYCWFVKENQPTLLADLRLLFTPRVVPVAPGFSAIPLDFIVAEQVDKGHGRREYRRLTVSSLLADYSDWPYLSQAFEVVRITWKGQEVSREERYGITSAPTPLLSARRLLTVVRGHWQIENGLHYRRDVTLHEDASQVRMGHAPQVLAGLNNAVCGILAHAGCSNLAAFQRSMAAAIDRLLFRN
ncbi:MAG: ISAs1 family transposase [Verrucomicrobiae bacterium]|nr:ISAs1 family transposase [Verrucomicrobiae bacterium]